MPGVWDTWKGWILMDAMIWIIVGLTILLVLIVAYMIGKL